MAASLVWALVLLAAIYLLQAPASAITTNDISVSYGSSEPNRIVGGHETSIENYPSIVQVDFLGVFSGMWGQSCAANILTTRHLLSAAHCFAGIFYSPTRRRIRAGTTYRNTGGVFAYVRREYNHPNYGTYGYDADISVVELITSLIYSPVVQQVRIMAQGMRIPDESAVEHAGWGATSQGGPASPVLLDVTIYTVNNQLCRERYATRNEIVTENMICAGVLDVGGRDACQGDSGGPLYYGDILIGVVSWGHGCANDTFPGVSAAVSPYTDWIIATAV